MKRLIKRAHNIQDLFYLEIINLEPTFYDSDRDEEEEGEKVEQEVEKDKPLQQE